jgi:carboxyl-terminal processing protease
MRVFIILAATILVPVTGFCQVDTSTELSTEDKITGMVRFWSEAKYNFAYFDQTEADWDATLQEFIPRILSTNSTWEYYLVLLEMSALLKDGHTDIRIPPELFDKTLFTPVLFGYTGGKYFISNVLPEEKDILPLGSVLEEIEGRPVTEWLEENLNRYISASTLTEKRNEAIRSLYLVIPDTLQSLRMQFVSPEGVPVRYEYRYRSKHYGWAKEKEPYEIYRMEILNDIAYVQLNSFGDEKVINLFREDIGKIDQSKGVILDLRKNGGGSTTIGAKILMHFTSADSLTGSAWKTRNHQASFKAWGSFIRNDNPELKLEDADEFQYKALAIYEGDYWYDGGTSHFLNDTDKEFSGKPVIVLAGPETGSAAEDFLVILRQLPDRKIEVLGSNTFGSTGQPLSFPMPGGGYARICTKRDTFADGTDFVGSGIIPDIEITPSVQDIINNRDVVLKQAQLRLRETM